MAEFKTGTIEANGLQFHYLEMGDGPLALCLHGFPDSPWTYRYLLPELAASGYRAVAPFMRGYAPTGIPLDARYDTATLAQDVVALHNGLGGDDQALLIANDWGAVAAYGGIALSPTCWRRCAILNVPPFAVFCQVAFRYEQIKRSFYFWFFQMQVANAVVPTADLAFLEGLWADWSPGYAAAEELARVKDCLGRPENLQAALGYYRAFFDPARFGSPEGMQEQEAVWGHPLTQPTLYLHGGQDGCIALSEQEVKGVLAHLGAGSAAERIDGVGHFMLVEKPSEVNGRILEFLLGKST